jgi:hypothetical protein
MPTLEQHIAAEQARLARLAQKSRKLETGQKIILGALILNAARRDLRIRDWLVSEVRRAVTREIDQKRLAPLLAELDALESPVVDSDRAT